MQDRLIAREDEDVSEAVREILEEEGVRVRLKAQCLGFEQAPGAIRMHIECDLDAAPIHGSHLRLAVGRTPNSDDLGLERAGIEVNERGFIRVDEALQTNVEGVWAPGEINGRGAFTHTSYNDYEIVAANLFDNDPRRTGDRIICYGLVIDPPLGRVGMTEKEARASGRNVLVGRRMMTQVGRAREFGETRGFMKILADADSKEILGAALLGLNGDEAVHSLLDLMYAKQP
jgi:pyruvate/2-oxoglutarate dehydrogenase complex dihydrolipoamide dehydrogenase (E3) component